MESINFAQKTAGSVEEVDQSWAGFEQMKGRSERSFPAGRLAWTE